MVWLFFMEHRNTIDANHQEIVNTSSDMAALYFPHFVPLKQKSI